MIDIDIKLRLKKEKMQFCFNCHTKRTVVFGPSGSGKTTLLKAIAGFYKPLSGKIIINNKIFFDSAKLINLPVYKRRLGYLPQEYTLFPNMNVKENILYGVDDKKKKSVKKKMEFITEKLQISHKLNSNPQLLSGGQQKRAALARIFMINPEILILDEPFAALDTPVKECLKGFVLEISEEMNIPVLFVSHVMEDSFSLGEGIVIVNNGKIVEFGNIDEVYRNPVNAETARLLDFKNIWNIDKIENRKCSVSNINSSNKLILNINEHSCEKEKCICVKPDRVKVLPYDEADEFAGDLYKGIILALHPRGGYFKLTVDVCGFTVESYISDKEYIDLNVKNGKKVFIKLDSKDFIFCR
jgi:molybdate transport system ATP-binding protein